MFNGGLGVIGIRGGGFRIGFGGFEVEIDDFGKFGDLEIGFERMDDLNYDFGDLESDSVIPGSRVF